MGDKGFSRGFHWSRQRLCDRVGSMRFASSSSSEGSGLGEVVPEFLTVERRWVSARIELLRVRRRVLFRDGRGLFVEEAVGEDPTVTGF